MVSGAGAFHMSHALCVLLWWSLVNGNETVRLAASFRLQPNPDLSQATLQTARGQEVAFGIEIATEKKKTRGHLHAARRGARSWDIG
ncbi:hypothetical protein BCR34DRAFT_342976 [Clohesyomyces aquaticus]|uniref:Uncharacterized protein n=1 Tax=Clohesyomyces aquaticus TaxID=1231657 RepID=A0A1Y2A7A8_9PLEO|nr:hypothetical protein BCR34DRAFT_342976 [Clohesyomyces aquaticus]